MAIDAWLSVGTKLPDGARVRMAEFAGPDWQLYGTQGGGRALVVEDILAQRWQKAGLTASETLSEFRLGDRLLHSISSGPSQVLLPVSEAQSPDNKVEALAFAQALKATRCIDQESALQDAIYVEKITRLLPTYSISSRTSDEIVLGYWLTGGTSIPATAFRRLRQNMSWIGAKHLRDVVEAAGFAVAEIMPLESPSGSVEKSDSEVLNQAGKREERPEQVENRVFELPGRPDLAQFFNEHIVDIIIHRDRYRALGIEFPSAVILHGPPGCGKTFAVEKLVDFLGWPSFQIDASSVASPYIHETSKKVAQVFEKAMDSAPSVLVIDEMEAFLADRDMGSGSSHHRVEEVAEFLRRIPEAVKKEVLIVAMTNRIDLIDPAIQRRGRFDHVIKVDFASEAEVRALMDKLLAMLPRESDVDTGPLARELAGRPLSDVAFVVREGARLAARSGRERLDQASLVGALQSTPARDREGGKPQRRIGFV